jgi:CMP-N,N'-diacetyllegionaminic acid synthase
MKPLILIPARAGSKGLPGKNIKKLNGKPLIQYSIEAARSLFEDTQICISTDDLQVISLCSSLDLKVPFVRPENLATDRSSSFDVILHALNFYENNNHFFDTLILLQPTSPFRTSKHIEEAIDIYNNNLEVDMVVSVKESHSNPYFNLFEETPIGLLEKSKNGNFTRRQDSPKIYEYNGAIYIIKIDSLKKSSSLQNLKNIKKYLMSEDDSIDIDTALDWKLAELISKQNL